jgi:mannose-6-phosphate isomerase-like protein (cupin superfamily)
MAQGYAIDVERVEPQRQAGDTAAVRPTIGAATGCEHLEQLVIAFAPGRSAPRATRDVEEVLYVLAGAGSVVVGDDAHAVDADTGVYIAPGEHYAVDNPGPGDLTLVAVRIPAGPPPDDGPRAVAVRLGDQETRAATADRQFRLVNDPETGCRNATQFVGYIPPGRAPEHYHHYDEVIYVLRGDGVLHLAGGPTELKPGSCIHLPPHARHCLENVGRTPMEVVGVFRPAGSPSEAYYPDGTPAISESEGTAS